MKLSKAIRQYIQIKRGMGTQFREPARVLMALLRTVGDSELSDIDSQAVKEYILGTGPITRYCHSKRSYLNGFFEFAVARELIKSSPLPSRMPKKPPPFEPYIYTHDELRRLLKAAESFENSKRTLRAPTLQSLILIL